MATVHGPDADEECKCDNPRELRLDRTLIHGVVVRCRSCDEIYRIIEDPTIFDQLAKELAHPEQDEMELTLDKTIWEHAD